MATGKFLTKNSAAPNTKNYNILKNQNGNFYERPNCDIQTHTRVWTLCLIFVHLVNLGYDIYSFIYLLYRNTNQHNTLIVALWNSNLGPTLHTFRLRGLCVMETVMASRIQRLAFPGSHYYCLFLTYVALRGSSAFLSNLFKDNEHAFLTYACNARCQRSLVCFHVGYIRSQCKALYITIVFLFYAKKYVI